MYDKNQCPVCGDEISDSEDYRTPDKTSTRYHPGCWDEAIRNKGQAFDPRYPSIERCSSCNETFDYTPSLHMGITYCEDCAPEGADKPQRDNELF